MSKKLLMVLLAMAPFGCASTEVFRSSTDTYPPVPQNSVLVFFDKADITVPYKIIGEVLAEGSSGWGSDNNDLVKKAQKKAGQMGANGILVQPSDKATGSQRVMASLFGTNDNKQRVTALRLQAQP
jgi:hypothetical protein